MSDLHPEVVKVAPGALGSLVALPFLKGSWTMRISMVLGGAALSYLGSEWLAIWLQMTKAQGLVGFFVGMFGMALVAKVFEVVQSFNASVLGQLAIDWIKKRLGV